MIEIRASNVEFYSHMDEESFIQWLEGVSSIERTYGEVNDIVLEFTSSDIPEEDLRELIALCKRYSIPIKLLSVFLNEENRSWLTDRTTYWGSELSEVSE